LGGGVESGFLVKSGDFNSFFGIFFGHPLKIKNPISNEMGFTKTL
jgi:hypothetical protein